MYPATLKIQVLVLPQMSERLYILRNIVTGEIIHEGPLDKTMEKKAQAAKFAGMEMLSISSFPGE